MKIPKSLSGADRRYLEDLAVGQRFTTANYQLNVEEIVAFARQFDPQPFHLDPEEAKDSLFGGLAASGWHTAAISMRLLVETGPPARGRACWCKRGAELAKADAAWRHTPCRNGNTRNHAIQVAA